MNECRERVNFEIHITLLHFKVLNIILLTLPHLANNALFFFFLFFSFIIIMQTNILFTGDKSNTK